MIATPLPRLRHLARRFLAATRARFTRWTQPSPLALAAGAAADAGRTARRPRLTAADRGLLVLLASRLRTWADALVIVRPETVLRWHRQGFRLFWRWKSTPRATGRIPAETVDLIRRLAAENHLWGADRIRGELLKLDVRASKRTIQKYMRSVRPRRPAGQSWSALMHNHAAAIWACDFLPITDLCFRPRYAFFVIALGSRRVVHVGVTRYPTDAWVTQQLREATPFGAAPGFLIRDNDGKYGPRFDRLAAASGIHVLRTPYRAPRAGSTSGERHLRALPGERAPRVHGPPTHPGRGAPAARTGRVCRLLQ